MKNTYTRKEYYDKRDEMERKLRELKNKYLNSKSDKEMDRLDPIIDKLEDELDDFIYNYNPNTEGIYVRTEQ